MMNSTKNNKSRLSDIQLVDPSSTERSGQSGLIKDNKILMRREFEFVKKMDITNKLNKLGIFKVHGKIIHFSRISLWIFSE